MLLPRIEEGTPQSIQDNVPGAVPASGFENPTTVPASSGTVQRLMLVHSQPMEPIGEGRPAGANEEVLESRQRPRRRVVGSQLSANRFSALGDDPEVEDEASGGEESRDAETDLRFRCGGGRGR